MYSSKFTWSFRNDHKSFYQKIFLTAAYSTGFDTSNYENFQPMNHKNQAKSQKFKTTEIWSHMVRVLLNKR